MTPRPVGFDDLVDRVGRLRHPSGTRRRLVGIVGPPGVGKTTTAHRLARRFDPPLAIVPMDGFHLPNVRLDRLGRRGRKGAPDTFDATSFVRLLTSIRESPSRAVHAPGFDRVVDEPVPHVVTVTPADEVVIVEGNYLLLDRSPWDAIRDLLDLAVYIDLDGDERRRRLVDRHVRFGKGESEARTFVVESDERNARLVAESRRRADVSVAE